MKTRKRQNIDERWRNRFPCYRRYCFRSSILLVFNNHILSWHNREFLNFCDIKICLIVQILMFLFQWWDVWYKAKDRMFEIPSKCTSYKVIYINISLRCTVYNNWSKEIWHKPTNSWCYSNCTTNSPGQNDNPSFAHASTNNAYLVPVTESSLRESAHRTERTCISQWLLSAK